MPPCATGASGSSPIPSRYRPGWRWGRWPAARWSAMTNSRRVAATTAGRWAGRAAGLLVALLALAGCDSGSKMGDVAGTVTVDGQTPAAGSSITFIPTDGKSGGGGDTIKDGKYAAKLPAGVY